MKIKERFRNQNEYEVVDKIPTNYFVWNIGEYMGTNEYIPLCENLHPGDKNDFYINPNTLKAIKLTPDEVQKLRDAACWGVVSLETAKKALNSKREGYLSDKEREHAKITIKIFERITE